MVSITSNEAWNRTWNRYHIGEWNTHIVHFKNDGEGITFTATEDTRILFLTGEPLNQEVVSYGPFVMNNQTQIMEAMRDYQMGKMGVLIEH